MWDDNFVYIWYDRFYDQFIWIWNKGSGSFYYKIGLKVKNQGLYMKNKNKETMVKKDTTKFPKTSITC